MRSCCLLLLCLACVLPFGCSPEPTDADGGTGSGRLPAYRGDDDAGPRVGDGGPAPGPDGGPCPPEIAGARFGVCGGTLSSEAMSAAGGRFGVVGQIETSVRAVSGGGRFAVSEGGIHVP